MKKIRMITAVVIIAFAVASFIPCDGAAAAKGKSKTPSRVKNLTVSGRTQKSVTLKWGASKKAWKYEVWQKKGKKFRKIRAVKKRNVTIKGMKPGTAYRFRVRGIRGKRKGAFSKVRKAMTLKEVRRKKKINEEQKQVPAKSDNDQVTETPKDDDPAAGSGSDNDQTGNVPETGESHSDESQTEKSGLKYQYGIYKLKDQEFFTDSRNQYILIKTNNPDKNSFSVCGKVTRPSETSTGALVFKDLDNMKDRMNDGSYLYYTAVPVSSIEETKRYSVVEDFDDLDAVTDAVSEKKCGISYISQNKYLKDWITEEIQKHTEQTMNRHEKMQAVCDGMRSSAFYSWTGNYEKYTPATSMYLLAMPKKISRCWDSGYKAPLFEIARQLDYEIKDYKEAGYSDYWHACVFGYYGGEEHRYAICPETETAKDIQSCRQLTLDDYVQIARIDE